MTQNFWEKIHATSRARGEPFFVLAPMAEVTDAPFRQVIVHCGKPDVMYNEFVSCEGLCSAGRERLLRDLVFEENERPIVAQFFGTKPDQFFECAKLAREVGFDGIDINMGCPDRRVVKQGAGIGLCRTPELAREIITATREGAGSVPVSVKTRLGINTIEIETWIPRLLEMHLPALTVHGRTMKELSNAPAHWDAIGHIVAMAKGSGTLIVGNGDVTSRDEGFRKAEQYGVDGIMVGRGIFHNPWFFNAAVRPEHVTPHERLALLLDHTERFYAFWGEEKNFNVLKRFYKVYVTEWEGARELRARLMETKNAEQVRALIQPLLHRKYDPRQ